MKRLLLTGATGFLGKNILPSLSHQYAVTTLSRSKGCDIECDLSVSEPLIDSSFDVILHAAGLAHVNPKTEEDSGRFYQVNYQGTINLCKALEKVDYPRCFIYISTVAVYGCEKGENIDEGFPLNGDSPYAKSKIKVEKFLQQWCMERNVALTILRPSLIAGLNPPGNLGDMIKGIRTGRYFCIAGGEARKSVLMTEDIARLIPLCEEKSGVYNICDDHHPTMRELENVICSQLGKPSPVNIPYWMAKCMALCGDCLGSKAPINSSRLRKLTSSLTFSNEKAKRELGWKPVNVLENYKM